jgi:hypothetical protein
MAIPEDFEDRLAEGVFLPEIAAGTTAVLVRRIAEARKGPRQIY